MKVSSRLGYTCIPYFIASLVLWALLTNERADRFITEYNGRILVIMLILYAFAAFIVFGVLKCRSWHVIYTFIMLSSCLVRALYILAASYNISKHDIGSFQSLLSDGSGVGHLGLIEYLFDCGHLPDFDPRQRWSFYNPPGYHILAAIVLKITYFAGVDELLCYESIKVVNYFFTSASVWAIVRILQEFNLKKRTLALFSMLASFSPFFILFAAETTNDAMCTFFMILACLYTIRWTKNLKLSFILMIAFCVGLSMFAKLNAAVISFGIGGVFIVTLWMKRNNKKIVLALVGQFVAFLLVCAPIGLFYPIRNLVKFDMPLLYIQQMSKDSFQYIGDANVWERIGIFFGEKISYAFARFDNTIETNIWIQTIRTALFDEILPNTDVSFISDVAVVFLWIGIITAVVFNIAFFYVIIRDRTYIMNNFQLRILFILGYLATMASYLRFCFSEPFICTMNFRYISIMILFLVCTGAGAYEMLLTDDSKTKKILRGGYEFLIIIFVFFCFVMDLLYILLATGGI